MIIGTSEHGAVRQCEKCNTVYKGNHCPHCEIVRKNDRSWPKRKRKMTYAEKQIKSSLKLSEEQEKAIRKQENK